VADTDRLERPAFYALSGGGWRDLVTILHPPYTAWNLANVGFGAAAATQIHTDRFVATLAAFFLAVGISAHALDELNGRPLKTELSDRALIGLAVVSLAGAIAIGIAGCIIVSATLAPFVLVGGFFVVAYNLELFGGAFHSTLWFALAWGALPALSAYVVEAETVRVEAVAAAVYAALLSYAQRVLSTPVRIARRQEGTARSDLETVLLALAAASVSLGTALLVLHLR